MRSEICRISFCMKQGYLPYKIFDKGALMPTGAHKVLEVVYGDKEELFFYYKDVIVESLLNDDMENNVTSKGVLIDDEKTRMMITR